MDNKGTHQLTESLFNKRKLSFFHHEPEPGLIKKSKYVIYDLGEVSSEEIIEDLNHYGLHPLDIKKMTMKSPRYPGHTNYIVYFKYDDKTTLQMVKTAKYLCHTSVKWAHYNPPTSQERQCENCWRHGHRKFGCRLPSKCMFCASTKHIGKDCPLVLEKERLKSNKIPSEHLICANCGGNHTAIFNKCPARINYNAKHQPRQQQTHITVKPTFVDAPAPVSNPWTARTSSSIQLLNLSTGPQPSAVPKSRSRSRTKRSRSSSAVPSTTLNTPVQHKPLSLINNNRAVIKNKTQNKIVYNSLNQNTTIEINLKSSSHSSSPPPLQPEEMTGIFGEMLSICGRCRTREEQLNALLNLALKYMSCQ